MTQICKECEKGKPISEFEWQKNRPNPRKVCKECRYKKRNREKERERHKEYSRVRRIENPDKVRQQYEKSVYGVTKEQLNQCSCQICGSTQRLCIDHCHKSKIVRGILCSKCNLALGLFDDSIDKLKAAVLYLDGPHFQIEV